jgi:hypothetical protein
MTPATTRATQARRASETGSWEASMPTRTVPTAPIPVKGRVRRADGDPVERLGEGDDRRRAEHDHRQAGSKPAEPLGRFEAGSEGHLQQPGGEQREPRHQARASWVPAPRASR